MSFGRTCWVLVLALSPLQACNRPAPHAKALAIVDGTEDPGDLGVVALVTFGGASCTGTLIAPRVVLTAGHCVAVLGPNASQVYFGSSPATEGELRSIVRTERHPEFDAATLANDLQLLLLDPPAPEEARPWPLLATPLDDDAVDSPIRLVGFGRGGEGEESDLKREGTTTIREVRERELAYSPNPSTTCLGDSGGPVFLTTEDGTEVLVAVSSRGDPACAETATAIRTDVHRAGFVEPFVAASAEGTVAAGARCYYDGQCREGSCLETEDDPPLRFCAPSCQADEQCPDPTRCEAGSCRYPVPSPGALEASCRGDADCELGVCVRRTAFDAACKSPCDPAWPMGCPDGQTCVEVGDRHACVDAAGGSCAVHPRPEPPHALVLLLVAALALGRRPRRCAEVRPRASSRRGTTSTGSDKGGVRRG